MFVKKVSVEGDRQIESTYECAKVMVATDKKDGAHSRLFLSPIRSDQNMTEIVIGSAEEKVGLFLMNDNGRTIEVIRNTLEP